MEFVGRKKEIAILKELYESPRSEMVAMVGRRRVGKTTIIHHVFRDAIDFHMVGIQNAPKEEQLKNFHIKLSEYAGQVFPEVPTSWFAAFQLLKTYLSGLKKRKKKVLFIDELPWTVTHRSRFLEHLAHFWNDWAVNNNVILILCGSATSWMIKKIVNSKGGLHNRLSRTISLQPFNLAEFNQFLRSRKIETTEQQLFELYMVLGGIPHYLNALHPKLSVPQNINKIIFEANALLENEFENLMLSLFEKPNNHFSILTALAKKWKGLSRKEVIQGTKIKDGGTLTETLSELELSGFIASYLPFAKNKKDTLFRIIDPFLLFYYKFIKGKNRNRRGDYLNLREKPTFRNWSGYAFENLCFMHLVQIKKALKIEAIQTTASSFIFSGNDDYDGIQIDLIIDRADGIINLCEMKFHNTPFVITKKYAAQLRARKEIFKTITKTKKVVNIVFVSVQGLDRNAYSDELIFARVIGRDLIRK